MGIKERKEREKKIRWQQIQEAAKALFLSKGYASTTMEDIAQKAELSTGTIYQYFKNKEELYASLNLMGLQNLIAKVEKIYKNNRLSTEKKIFKFKDAMYSTFQSDPLLYRVVFHLYLEDTMTTIDKELRNELERLGRKLVSIFSSTYKEGMRGGDINNGHAVAHADIIWATFAGLVMVEEGKRKLYPKKDFLKPTLDLAFDIFCRGISKKALENKKLQ